MGDSDRYKRLSISLPPDLFSEFEKMRKQLNQTRSDAVRKAMNSYLIEQKNVIEREPSKQNIVACISYVEKSHIHAHPPQKSHSHGESAKKTEQNQGKGEHTHEHHSEDQLYYVPVEQIEFLKANEIQHEYLDVIQSSMHIHIGAESCMEVISCSGSHKRIDQLYQSLQKLKTIKKIEFSVMDVLE